MNKKELFFSLRAEIEKNLEIAMTAAQNTYDIATHEENKAENKYDTRGLEASYLAGAQAKRVMDLKETLQVVINVGVKNFDSKSKIALTALIETESQAKKSYFLLLQKGGGQSFKYNEKLIQVITPESPMGKNLVGRSVDDEFEINGRLYEIKSLF